VLIDVVVAAMAGFPTLSFEPGGDLAAVRLKDPPGSVALSGHA
jgi:hypothetical protein